MNYRNHTPVALGAARVWPHPMHAALPLWRRFMIWPFFLWALVWATVNTGPWRLPNAVSVMDYIHGYRAYAVFVVAFLTLGALLRYPYARRITFSGAVGWLFLYGLAGLLASIFISRRPESAVYWGGAFVACLLVPAALGVPADWVTRARDFLRLNWLAVLIIAGVIVFLGADALFGSEIKWDNPAQFRAVEPAGTEGVADMTIPRSTGAGRYTGLFAVVALAGFWNGRTWEKPVWASVFVVFALATLLYHGRGATVGFIGGCLAVLAFSGSMGKRGMALMGLVFLPLILFPNIIEWLILYMQRGSDPEAFWTFTGRTRDWAIGWELYKTSPAIGLGFWADRLYVPDGHHFHNSFVHALVTGGTLGFIPFVMVWVWSWIRFLKLQRIQAVLPRADARALGEVGGVLTFLTLRSFPESTGAFFGVDLFIFVPVLVYLQVAGDHYLPMRRRVGKGIMPSGAAARGTVNADGRRERRRERITSRVLF